MFCGPTRRPQELGFTEPPEPAVSTQSSAIWRRVYAGTHRRGSVGAGAGGDCVQTYSTSRCTAISNAATTSLNYVASERSRTLHSNEHSDVAKYMGMEGREEEGKGWK